MATIIPAIDILNGEAVRLYKGNHNQKTVYGNPIEIAQKFKSMGAKLLHIVDLDGAKTGSPCNLEIIKQIASIIPIQVGGGIRSIETIEKYLKFADYVVLGTAAREFCTYSDRIIVAVDVKNGKVATQGWLENSGIDYLEFINNINCKRIICTDISKDGTLTSPNWEMYDKIKNKEIIISGGVACNADIIKASKYYGVIVGKAYYEGKVDLEKCLKSE